MTLRLVPVVLNRPDTCDGAHGSIRMHAILDDMLSSPMTKELTVYPFLYVLCVRLNKLIYIRYNMKNFRGTCILLTLHDDYHD